jgi:hypothetical protein
MTYWSAGLRGQLRVRPGLSRDGSYFRLAVERRRFDRVLAAPGAGVGGRQSSPARPASPGVPSHRLALTHKKPVSGESLNSRMSQFPGVRPVQQKCDGGVTAPGVGKADPTRATSARSTRGPQAEPDPARDAGVGGEARAGVLYEESQDLDGPESQDENRPPRRTLGRGSHHDDGPAFGERGQEEEGRAQDGEGGVFHVRKDGVGV